MKASAAIVLELLRARGSRGLTSLECWNAGGGSRLAARISDLRVDGFLIRSRPEHYMGKRYARYFLTEQPVQLRLDVA